MEEWKKKIGITSHGFKVIRLHLHLQIVYYLKD